MTTEQIKELHAGVTEIEDTIGDYEKAHTEITLIAIIDVLQNSKFLTVEDIDDRVNELRKQKDQL